jgi:hypothetical protein
MTKCHSSKHNLPRLVPPRVKKKIRKTAILLFFIVVLFIIGLLFLGVKVKFLISEELEVKISSNQSLYSVKSDQLVGISFVVENNNFLRCDSYCEYSLIDLMDNQVKQTDHFFLGHSEAYFGGLQIPATNNGNKLFLYDLQVKCHNIKSLICRTEEKNKHNSALFILETEYSGQELLLNKKIEENLNLALNKHNGALSKIAEQREKLNFFFILSNEEEILTKNLDEIETEFVDFENSLMDQIKIWQGSELKKFSTLTGIDSILTDLTNLDIQLYSLIELRNSTLNIINRINQIKEEIIESYHDSPLIAKELNKIELVYQQITNGGNFSEQEINQVVQESESVLFKLVDDYQQEKEQLVEHYSDALNKEYNGSNCLILLQIKEEIVVQNLSGDTNNLENFINKNCIINQSTFIFPNLTLLPVLTTELIKVENKIFLGEQKRQCCAFNTCKSYGQNNETPTLFIHGHSFNEQNTPEVSLAAFAKIQEEMQSDHFINVGDVSYEHFYSGLDKCSFPMTMRATYYYIPHLSFGKYQIAAQKTERIENYALRLREMIQFIKDNSGSSKINIVAHSMGGLVLRQYVDLFGANDLNKIIFVNVPHKGVSGKVEKYCSVIGASKECEDLSVGSIFLQRINSKPLPGGVELYNLRSKGCLMDNAKTGDGIVTFDNAYLEGVEDFIIEGKCTDTLQTSLHNDVLDPEMYPQTVGLITRLLKK